MALRSALLPQWQRISSARQATNSSQQLALQAVSQDWRELSGFRVRSKFQHGASVAVIGGGPAGVCVAATAALRPEIKSVVFFDASGFRSGMMQLYPSVPSNTKLELLQTFLSSGPIGSMANKFKDVAEAIEQMRSNALSTPPQLRMRAGDVDLETLSDDHRAQLFNHNEQFDPSTAGWPRLGDMAAVFQTVCAALRRMPHVSLVDEAVTHVAHSPNSGWAVHGHSVDAVVFCQGATPRMPPGLHDAIAQGGARLIPLEAALDAGALQGALAPTDRVAVVGNSHTGALVLRNLARLSAGGQRAADRVRLFGLQPVRLARWSAAAETYLFTATGLKGVAAAFALEELARDAEATAEHRSVFARQESPDALQRALREGQVDAVVVAAGFAARPYPELAVGGGRLHPSDLRYCHATGELRGVEDGGRRVPSGLYEVGIGRPEYYTDSPGAAHPVCAYGGGAETRRAGWRGEHIVGWNHFGQRAAMVLEHLLCQTRCRARPPAS